MVELVTSSTAVRPRLNPRSPGKMGQQMGARVRIRRVEQGMSQEDLGKKLGVTFQQVQKYEKGANRISSTRLEQLAKALDVSVTYFFGGSHKERETESLISRDASYNLRLLRAYAAIKDPRIQRHFVGLMEQVAGLSDE